MSDLNMQFVREFFELNRFRVLTHWQHEDLLPMGAEAASLLFIEHVNQAGPGEPPFLLRPEDLPLIGRAVVEVRAWHTDRLYPSAIETSPALGHVASREVLELGESVFESADFTTILVISELAASSKPRERALEMLRELGVGHVLEFSTVLQDILDHISAHGSYAPSQTLQTMRLLKRYRFIRRQQLEFAFQAEPRTAIEPARVEGVVVEEETVEDPLALD